MTVCLIGRMVQAKKAAGSYEKLNYATQQLKPLIEMKGGYSLTDTLIYKLSGV